MEKDTIRQIREGLARAGIITADTQPEADGSFFDVIAVNGRITEGTGCRVFSDAGKAGAKAGAIYEKAWLEHEISMSMYHEAPELFICPYMSPVPFEAEGRGYYAFLTEAGVPLAAVSESSTDFCVSLMTDICRALDILHHNGHIHSYISPASIVMKSGRFCLTGFGEAAASCRKIDQFTAPEIINGFCMPRSDIYSLTMVVRSLITDADELPQYIADTDVICERKRHLLPLNSEDPYRDRLLAILNKGAAYSPFDRYSSPSAMLKDLEELAENAGKDGRNEEYVHIVV